MLMKESIKSHMYPDTNTFSTIDNIAYLSVFSSMLFG
jgi:hypothetical protein